MVRHVTVELVDAQAMHQQHPDSFIIPSREAIDKAVRMGQFVKVCDHG